MKLFQIIANAQDGQAFANMGKAYGVDEDVIAQTIRYFAPALAKAIEKRAQTPEGLLAVLEFLGSRRFDRFLSDARIFAHAKAVGEGERVLSFLFVTPARIEKIIDNRAKVLPLEQSKLRELFPVIALLTMGATELRTRRPLGVILHRLTNGAVDSKAITNPYIQLAQYLRKQEREEKERGKRRLFSFLGGSSSSAAPNPEKPAISPPPLAQAG